MDGVTVVYLGVFREEIDHRGINRVLNFDQEKRESEMELV